MTITLYSKPGCPNCTLTANIYDRKGIDVVYRDVTEDDEAMARVRSLGYMQVPVVETSDGDHWSGINRDKILDSIRRVAESELADVAA